jgi:hypothetical protein
MTDLTLEGAEAVVPPLGGGLAKWGGGERMSQAVIVAILTQVPGALFVGIRLSRAVIEQLREERGHADRAAA